MYTEIRNAIRIRPFDHNCLAFNDRHIIFTRSLFIRDALSCITPPLSLLGRISKWEASCLEELNQVGKNLSSWETLKKKIKINKLGRRRISSSRHLHIYNDPLNYC